MSTEAIPVDRRQRRRRETIEEVLDVAAQVMAEQGVAGLSVGEVARRMGIRPPSLYVYFASKSALYDALFERGAGLVLAHMERAHEQFVGGKSLPLEAHLLHFANAFCRWAVEHPAYSQLLFWRPVPGFSPSDRAYEPAMRLLELGRERFAELQRRGLLRSDASIDDLQRDWTILTSGVISQQLSNAPDEAFDAGTFTTAIPHVVAMFARHYAPPSPSTSPKEARRADKR